MPKPLNTLTRPISLKRGTGFQNYNVKRTMTSPRLQKKRRTVNMLAAGVQSQEEYKQVSGVKRLSANAIRQGYSAEHVDQLLQDAKKNGQQVEDGMGRFPDRWAMTEWG